MQQSAGPLDDQPQLQARLLDENVQRRAVIRDRSVPVLPVSAAGPGKENIS